MITWSLGPEGLAFLACGFLVLCVVAALDYWVIRAASEVGEHRNPRV